MPHSSLSRRERQVMEIIYRDSSASVEEIRAAIEARVKRWPQENRDKLAEAVETLKKALDVAPARSRSSRSSSLTTTPSTS